MTEKQRNELLVEMTDAVAEQVLYGSYTQTQAMSLALAQAAPMVDVHGRLIRNLEQVAGLDREIEFLPDDEVIAERKAAHQGLVAPELAVVMAYCKIHLYSLLLESDLPEDDVPRATTSSATSRRRCPSATATQMRSHRLRREIIATVVANQLVDRAGTTFAFRLGRGDRRVAVDPRARLRGRARGLRHALVLGGGRGARQPGRRRDAAARC